MLLVRAYQGNTPMVKLFGRHHFVIVIAAGQQPGLARLFGSQGLFKFVPMIRNPMMLRVRVHTADGDVH